MITVTVGIEKLDDEFKVPVKEDITLEQFKIALEKALGYKCSLNISKYEQKKNQKVKDIIKGDSQIFLLKNENLGNIVKRWKGNYININNSCTRDALVKSIICSMIEKVVEQEEILRRNKGFPPAKNFKELNRDSSDNSTWKELLDACDDIYNKMKNNDTSPMYNFI